jgi:hypothetical protein
VGLEDIRHLHPVRETRELLSRHDERHPLEPPEQLILSRVSLVFNEIVVFFLFIYLGDDGELFGVFKIEEQLDRLLTAPHLYGLAADHCR